MRRPHRSLLVSLAFSLALVPSVPAWADKSIWAPQGIVEAGEIPELTAITGDLDYERALQGAVTSLESFPPEQYDLATKAQTLGALNPIYAFVRDEVRAAPYAGDLRGPEGTFAARAGNAADQAELLVEMLIEAGIDARVVSAMIADRTPLDLTACTEPNAENPLVLAQLDARSGARMHARAVRDYGLLTAALPPIDAVEMGMPPEAPHYWVQARVDGAWLDLDPMLTDGAPGASLGNGQPADAPPAHMIGIRVQTETLRDGALVLNDVLNARAPASELAEARVQLAFTAELSGTGGGIASAFSKALDQAPGIRPLLMINDDITRGDGFDTPAPPAAARGLGKATADPVTAIWLELSTTAPDGTQTTARRTIVDLVPKQARASGTVAPDMIMEPVKGTALPAGLEALHTIIISHGGLDPFTAAAMRALMILDLPEAEAAAADGSADQTQMLWQIWADAYAKSVSAEALVSQNTGPMGCAMVTAPRIYRFTAAGLGDESRLSTDWAIDGVSAIGATDPGAAAQIRIWQGVVQGAYETALAETMLRIFGGDVASASTLLSGPLALADPAPETGGWMTSADAGAGWLLVTGAQTPGAPGAWWRVDPASGATDARVAALGNHGHWSTRIGGLSQVDHTVNGAWDAKTGKFIPNNSGKPPNLGGKSWREVNKGPMRRKLEQVLAKLKQRKAIARQRKLRRYWNKRAGGGGSAGEYLSILENISIPVAVAVGTGVAIAVGGGFFYALTGEKP